MEPLDEYLAEYEHLQCCGLLTLYLPDLTPLDVNLVSNQHVFELSRRNLSLEKLYSKLWSWNRKMGHSINVQCVEPLFSTILAGSPSSTHDAFILRSSSDSNLFSEATDSKLEGPKTGPTYLSRESGSNEDMKNKSTLVPVRNISAKVKNYITSIWLTILVPSFYAVVFLVSLPLNVVAIIIFLFKLKVRTPAAIFMLNLAIADVFFVMMLPFNIIYRFSGNNWFIGEAMCRCVIALFYCNMYCSILLMTGISVDRLLAIVYPIESRSWRTVNRAWVSCLTAWVVSLAGALPLMMNDLTAEVHGLEITTCYDTLNRQTFQEFFIYYFMTCIIILFFIPLIITVACYIAIIRSLSATKCKNLFDKSRAISLSVIVLCEFVVCFGPTNVIFFMYCLSFFMTVNETLYLAYFICISISTISCCLDPIIYYYVSPECKQHFFNLLCCKKDDISLEGQSPGSTQKACTKESSV
ncbi:proteinase-activated receptor 1-like [Gastrophryne carolinensis]